MIPHVSVWERERPSVAVFVLSLRLLVHAMQAPKTRPAQEIRALREQLTRLLSLVPEDSPENQQATIALSIPAPDRR